MLATLVFALTTAAPALDVRVDGEGYLRFLREGRVVYAKSALLVVTDGALASNLGPPVAPRLAVPTGATVAVDLEGNVTATVGGKAQAVGRLVLAGEVAMTPRDGFLISANRPSLGSPGEGAFGVIRTGGRAGLATVHAEHRTTSTEVSANAKTNPLRRPAPTETAVWRGGKPTILVQADSQVDGDQILLGQIAKIHASPEMLSRLEGLSLGASPVVGVVRGIADYQINPKLRALGLSPADVELSVPPNAQVRRRAQRVPAGDFAEAAQAAVRRQFGAGLSLTPARSDLDFDAPFGSLELVAESVSRTATGFTVSVAVRVDGRRINSRQVLLSVGAGAEGVKAGQNVKVVVRSSGATITIEGRTRSAAFVGQQVTVVTTNNTTHTGVLTGPDRVEVRL